MRFDTSHQFSSIKHSFVYTVTLITAGALLIVFLINGLVDTQQKKAQLVSQVGMYADFVAKSLLDTADSLDGQTANAKLEQLVKSDTVENIQVYLIEPDTNQRTFFAGYHSPHALPISLNNKSIKNYQDPIFGSDSLLFCSQVNVKQNQAAFVCIRVSLRTYHDSLYHNLYIKAATLASAIVIAFIIALYLQSKITLPISELANLFKYVAKEKDYSVRAPKQNVEELDSLANSLNIMLDRVEMQLAQQKKAEAEILKLNQSLEDKIYQRTEALKDSNKELMDALAQLHEFQNQLVENQKMASLGDMVAGIAHEVNTPIGLGVTASTLIMDKLNQVEEALNQKKLTESHLVRFLADSKENLDIIYRNLNRSAELVTNFKQLAVSQTHESPQKIQLFIFLKDVLLALKPSTKQHQVDIDCDRDLEVVSKPGILQQILTNLVTNSVIHGFENIESGKITISIEYSNQILHIHYADNGKGISEQLKKKIFDPFVTTKRGKGGSGLGMNLVYNLVTQGLNGKISVESELGKGIQFDIKLPRLNPETD